MNKRFILITLLAILLLSALLGVYAYPRMPEQAVTHWDQAGNPNGSMSRFWALALMPLMLIGLTLLLTVVPYIDPLKKNILQFEKEYNNFILVFLLFMFYVHVLSVVWNLGVKFNLSNLVLPAMGAFIFFLGTLVGKAKRNYFIGIRTPWTLANDAVWDQTHKIGGVLYKAAGVISLLGFVFPKWSVIFLIAPLLGVSLFSMAYSYILFARIEKSVQ